MFSIRWRTVWLIFRREVRDQLRDRRTLFMVFALPILLYPMLGLALMKLAVALDQKPRTVVVVGAEHLPESPPLLTPEGGFAPGLFPNPAEASQYRVERAPAAARWNDPRYRVAALREGLAQAVILIPADARERLKDESQAFDIPLAYDSGDEQSRNTFRAVREILDNWREQIVKERLKRDAKSASYVQPVQATSEDVARVKGSAGSPGMVLFPFLLVIMSLTGAFYPAVDLCAGEKERGTMETLLISPATRPEIVTGKFLTVMLASMLTAVFNLLSMGLTAGRLASGLAPGGVPGAEVPPVLTAPSLVATLWMLAILVPLSAFFSALCLALAAMARSMKEGQYYLSPLYVVALPLVMATLVPGIKLDLFTSLVPVTGVSLLLRALLQEEYAEARRYFLPVLLPLLVYGALALRWAVDQFRDESVLFREAERLDPRAWLVHLVRDREPIPTGGMALLCFALMISAAWFTSGWAGANWMGLVSGQIVYILGPPVLLALLLTSSPRRTLRLARPSGRHLLLAAALAFALNPLANELRSWVELLFPLPESIRAGLAKLVEGIPNLGALAVALAVVPAICEEFAFRGFILSGLQRDYSERVAVVLSAFLFGFLHVLLSLFQQLFNATLLGVVLALLAIRSGSILPGILFHALNNGLALLVGAVATDPNAQRTAGWLFRDPQNGLYHGVWVLVGTALSAVLLTPLLRRETAAAEPEASLDADRDRAPDLDPEGAGVP
jgi:sodium transport system permease protein